MLIFGFIWCIFGFVVLYLNVTLPKFRVIQNGNNEFIVQKREWFTWSRKSISEYKSAEEAIAIMRKFEEAEIFKQNENKIKKTYYK